MALAIFARLKLRVLANGFRGQTRRIVLFVIGSLIGLYFAGMGFLLLSLSAVHSRPEFAVLVPTFGGTVLVLGWFFIPLVWTGVDETLDPSRFALLPLSRRQVVSGLLVAALLGVPALATLIATGGLVVGAAARGGPVAAAVELIGILLGVLLCVAVSRAVTSAFSSLLRARRTRDLAAVVLALLAALLGPLQIALITVFEGAKIDQMVRIARVIGWTPLGAPYLIGFDVADGRPGAAVARLVVAVAAIVALLWWWVGTIESAMVGQASGGAARAGHGDPAQSPVAQLFPRLLGWLPRTASGALAAREARYWWRDPRRRASLITIAVVGVFVPVMVSFSTSDSALPAGLGALSMLMIGSLAAVTLANQFGFDGTAYAAHLIVGVPGRVELRARVIAFSTLMVPLLIVIGTAFTVALGDPVRLSAVLGGMLGAYGTGIAVNVVLSIFGAYALPESTNPFAVSTGAGFAKSLFAMVALLGGMVLAAPVAAAAVLVGSAWSWVVLPLGVGYGLGAAILGIRIGGDLVDRRAPELLAAVTPRR